MQIIKCLNSVVNFYKFHFYFQFFRVNFLGQGFSFSSPLTIISILLTICHVNLGKPVSPRFLFLHVSKNRTLGNKWPRFFIGRMSFLSANQQCQSTEENNMYIPHIIPTTFTITTFSQVYSYNVSQKKPGPCNFVAQRHKHCFNGNIFSYT